MDDYFAGALLQLLEQARHLNTRIPRNLEREFHTWSRPARRKRPVW